MSKFQPLKKISFIRSIYNKINPVSGTILMLHRVTERRSNIKDNRILEITPAFLEETIKNFLSLNYEFVDIDTAFRIQMQEYKISKPYICFTFDDGFKDNLMNAYPVFKKYNIPFTIFIATDFPDGNACIWWYQLDEILQNIDTIEFPDGTFYPCKTIEEKNHVFHLAGKIIKNTPKEYVKSYIDKIFEKNGSAKSKMPSDVVPLTWNEIKTLQETGLCTIGSHGVTHVPLSQLNDYSLSYELLHSRERIEEQTGHPVRHLAYPYGDFSPRVAEAARKCGYLSAVKVGGGLQRVRQDPFHFKREGLFQK
jgi:peptidoglycan/xylan/chitin deacetylase (PgdA/CDA1 family)